MAAFCNSQPSSSSSTRSRWTHDVFLSFRGEDTRKNFTDHLYNALLQSGIHTYRDDEELPRGENISSQLLKAIQESRIAVVVFSTGYASSSWCLDELAKIIECRTAIGQIVLPIFYSIDPSDVRKQTGCFLEAFDRHKERFKEEIEKVKNWREALTEAANLSGWDLQNVANGHESKFIQKIVEDVSSKLNCKCYLNVARHPVGIDFRVEEIVALLSVNTNDVRTVGIYGMGGLGKTTLAKAVYNRLCDDFEGSCFLLNIKEISEQPNGLIRLQEQLLCDTSKSKVWKISNVDGGTNLIKERLFLKKLLVVLDDVDQSKHINALAGEKNWFGLGSRIIITTRDVHLLTQVEVNEKYWAEALDHDESLQLFSWHAFKSPHPMEDYVELSNGVVDYIQGLPLALEVLGSYLFKRSISEWESAIQKLRKVPHHQIQSKLRISFDNLDDDKVKAIFLDIACFFIGRDKEYVAKILDGCGFFSEIGINILLERSLVSIDYENRLRMHDLLRDMGREIVREISPNHLGQRNRLWFHEDVLDVLQKQSGTELMEGLMLDLPDSDVILRTESFAKMRYLRLLQINSAHLTGHYKYLSKELRWLCWNKCPLKSLPNHFQLDNLVVLEMQYSNIRKVWKKIMFLDKLKILNLSHSLYLVKTPNCLRFPNLERLILEGCTRLLKLHQSLGALKKLVFLNLQGCNALKSLPESICHLKSLEILNIMGCSKLEELPEHFGDVEALTEILADGTSIKQFPFSFGRLKNLRSALFGGLKYDSQSKSRFSLFSSWLSPRSMNSRALLPASFAGLSSLTELVLCECGLYDDAVAFDLSSLSALQYLDLSANKFVNLPVGIGHLSKLDTLVLNSCTNLLSISKLPSNLDTLSASNCTSMERVVIQSKKVPSLYLEDCKNLIEIEGLEGVENELFIDMQRCNRLANNFKRILLQVPSMCDSSIYLTASEVPNWFSHEGHGSLLSFYVPAFSDVKFEGLILWVVFTATKVGSSFIPFASFTNESDNFEFVYGSSYFLTSVRGDFSWVTHVSLNQLPTMEGGEELNVAVRSGHRDILVKKCGVFLLVNESKFMASQVVVMPYMYLSSSENLDAGAVEKLDKNVVK